MKKISTEISTSVKEVLSSLTWDYKTGTIHTKELTKNICIDSSIKNLVAKHNLKNIKHKSISIEDLLKNSINELNDLKSPVVDLNHILCGLLKSVGSKKYKKVKADISTNYKPKTPKKVNQKPKTNNSFSYEQFLLSKGFINNVTKNLKLNDYKSYVSNTSIEDTVLSIISRKEKKSIVAVGGEGSGKTSLAFLISKRLKGGSVPKFLSKSELITINLPALINYTENKTKFEEFFRGFLREKALNNDKHTIVFFDDMHLLPSLGLQGFTPPIEDSYIGPNVNRVVNSSKGLPLSFIATIDEEHLERFYDTPLHKEWQVVELSTPSKNKLVQIFNLKLSDLIKYYNVSVSKSAKKLLFNIFNNEYNTSGNNLRQALSSVDTVLSNSLLKNPHIKKIKVSNIKKYQTSVTNDNNKQYAVLKIKKVASLNKYLKSKIIGQNDAIESIAKSVKRAVFKLNENNQPLSSLLFLGPTGVGKTETAKQVATHLFGSKKLIRIDMADFMERHTISRLVGSPPGYVGYGEGGQLTQFVQDNPKCVVLFDEIEKAHPDVLNILLSILEEGEVTTGDGVVVDFSKTIVVLTSNMGASMLNSTNIGFLNDKYKNINSKIKDTLTTSLKKTVKPEIINRLNEVIVFNILKQNDAKKIVNKNINIINSKFLSKYNIKIKADKKVANYLTAKGYSNEYGVREINRVLDKYYIDLVVDKIIQNKTQNKKINKISIKKVNNKLKLISG